MKTSKIFKKATIYTFLYISFVSCSAQTNNFENDLKNCINEEINKYASGIYQKESIYFYVFALDIEKKLMDSNLIKNNKKEDYINLFDTIEKEKSNSYKAFFEEILIMMENKGFDLNSFVINNAIYSKCPYDAIIKLKNYKSTSYYEYFSQLNSIMNNGFNNQEMILNLLKSTNQKEFSNIYYRAPIILLAILNMDIKLNPTSEMKKFRVDDKTYLKPKEQE
ncbi:hypothetical protein [Formosa maritima]|uniref:Lipoprotein n=1 Tax=Formosa maritima TaxID=2592046 RepID=A0A5D0GDK4_9FLAO|nr:hypothetical protein [Formosa maritima]TYA56800.1 hypothetical protein FVF61_05590 [Formosa maritima]